MDDDPSKSDISLVGLPPPRNIEIRPKVFINNITARLIPLQNNGIQRRKLIKIKTVAGTLQKPSHNIPIIKFLTGDKYLNNDSQINTSKKNNPLTGDSSPSVKLYEISQPPSVINSSCNPIKLVTDSNDRLPEKKDSKRGQNGTGIVAQSKKSVDTAANNIKNAGSKLATFQQSKSLHVPRVITTTPSSLLIQNTLNNKSTYINLTTNKITTNMTNSNIEDNSNLLDIVNKIDSAAHDDRISDDKINSKVKDTKNDNEKVEESGSINESTVENDYEFALRLQKELDAEEKRKRLRRKSEPKLEAKFERLTTKVKQPKKESQTTKKDKKKEDKKEEGISEETTTTNTKKRGRKAKKETVTSKEKSDDETKSKSSPNTDGNLSKELPKKRGRKSKKIATNVPSNTTKVDEVSIEKSSDSPTSESSMEKENNIDLSLEKYPRPPTMGFEKIIKNVYRCEPDIDYRLADEVCDCRPPDPNNIEANSGCGENCISRCMNLECHGCAFGRKGCSNRRMQRRQNAPVEAFWAGIKGWGLRAKADITKGDFIMEYCGEVLNGKQENRRARRYAKDKQKHHYFMHLTSLTTIDAYYKGNISRCMNHSCDPNAQTEKWRVKGITRVGFFATKNIKKGDEICFNYRFFNYGKEPQKCYCGAGNCRGTIGEAIPNDPSAIDDDYESSSCTDTDSASEEDFDEEDEGVDVTLGESPPDENKIIEKKEDSTNIVKPKKLHKSPSKKSKVVEVKESTPPRVEEVKVIKDTPKKSPEKDAKKVVEGDMSDSTLSSDEEVDESPLVKNKKEESPVVVVELTKEELQKIEFFKEKATNFMESVNKEAENKSLSSATITRCCDMLNDCFSIQQSIFMAPIIKKITETKTKETQLLENGILKVLTDHLSLIKFVDGKGHSMFNMDMLNYIEMLLDSIINILLYEKMGKYARYIAESQLEVVLLEVYGKLVQMVKDSTISHNNEMIKLVGEIKEKVAYAKNKAKGYINEDPDAMKSTAIIEDKINRQQRKEARDSYRYSHRKQRYRDLYYRRREYSERRRNYESRHRYSSRRSSYDKKRSSPSYSSYKNKRRRDVSEDSYYNDTKRTKTDYREDSYRGDCYTKRSYPNNRSPSRGYRRSRHRSKSVDKKYSNDSRKYNECRKRSRSHSSDRLRHRNLRKYSESPEYDKKDRSYRREYKRRRSNSLRNSSSRHGDSRSRHKSRSPRRESLTSRHRWDDEKRKEDKKIDDSKSNYKDSTKSTSSSSKSERNKYNDRKRSPTPIKSYDNVKKSRVDVVEKEVSGEKIKERENSDEKVKETKTSSERDKDRKNIDVKSIDKKIFEEKNRDKKASEDKYRDKKSTGDKTKDKDKKKYDDKDKKSSSSRYTDKKSSDEKSRERRKSEDKDKKSSDDKGRDKSPNEKSRNNKTCNEETRDNKHSDDKTRKTRTGDDKYKDKRSSDDKHRDKKTSDDSTKDKKTSSDKDREYSPYVPTLKRRVDEIMGFSKNTTSEIKNEEVKKEEVKDKKTKEKISLSDLHHQINLAHSKIKALNEKKPAHVKEISKN